MALTKINTNGVSDSAITSAKINDGAITNDDINATLDLSSKTVTLPAASVTAHATNPTKASIEALGIDLPAADLTGTIADARFPSTLPAISGANLTGIETVTKSTTAPSSPAAGDMWFDTTAGINIMKVWNGIAWSFMNKDSTIYTVATGGAVTTDGDYKVHTFNSSGTFTVTTLGADTTLDYLVVAGGGGGGEGYYGGGGGAGGYRNSFNSESSGGGGSSESALTATLTAYSITVGGGGAGATTQGNDASNGGSSIFSTITSIGGGGGASRNSGSGAAGGSGGGGARAGDGGGSGTSNQGYSGGGGSGYGHGGGGAGQVGVTNITSPWGLMVVMVLHRV